MWVLQEVVLTGLRAGGDAVGLGGFRLFWVGGDCCWLKELEVLKCSYVEGFLLMESFEYERPLSKGLFGLN